MSYKRKQYTKKNPVAKQLSEDKFRQQIDERKDLYDRKKEKDIVMEEEYG